MPLQDLTGCTFGRLVVQRRIASLGGARTWECRCSCGHQKTVRSADLTSGKVRSCGCLGKERRRSLTTRHGHNKNNNERTPEYNSWRGMLGRCLYPKNKKYADYGGRGIIVCERWRKFENFLADMGCKPTPRHTLDRKDSDGDYTPENCCWATRATQSRNTRRTRWVTHAGRTQCLQDWANELGIPPGTLSSRLDRGWSIGEALDRV